MEIRAEGLRVDGPHGPLLPPTSLRVACGQVALVGGEPGLGLTTLALALAGRIRPSEGQITVDGESDAAALRRHVAIVDVPGVTEPDGTLRLVDVISEDLALAGVRPRTPRAVRRWLAEREAEEFSCDRVDQVPASVRTGLLMDVAAARPGVGALVLTCPDRHTTDTSAWWPSALRHAERGLAVVALCAATTAATLPVPAALSGQHDQPPPLTVASPSAAAATPDTGDTQ